MLPAMKLFNRTGLQNSGTETRLRQVLSHLHMQSLDEPACQVCDDLLREGDPITLYLYKPAGRARYSIGQCRCRTHDDNLPELFTLGVRELIVDGRIGQCRDHATQQAWPVLLAPSVRLISAADTSSGRVVSSHKQQGQGMDSNSENPGAISSCQPSLSLLDQDGSSDTTAAKSVRGYTDG